MTNQNQPTQPNRTIWTWWNLKAVQIMIGITALIYFISIVIFYWISQFNELNPWKYFFNSTLPPMLEVVSVFVGLVLGFYWNRADKIRMDNFDRRRITGYLITELEANGRKLQYLYHNKGQDYTSSSLQTTVWDIYEEKIGILYNIWVPRITDIYHRLSLLNEYITRYPDIDRIRIDDRKTIHLICDNTRELIETWVKEAQIWFNNPNLGRQNT